MISPEQLASALDRLDPRDRELLSLSLRRRVPDDDLARMYDIDAGEVARRRAGAIDRLSGQLGIQRAEDLGAVLKALLEDEIWKATDAPGSEFSPAVADEPEPRRLPHVAFALFGIGLAALLGALALVGITELGNDDGQAAVDRAGGDDGTRHFVPEQSGPAAAPFPSEPQEVACYTTAYVRRPATLRRRPAGGRLLRVAAQTEWKSPRVFGVVRREGDWLAVQAPELPNGRVGWLRTREARLDCTTWSLHADLSKRKLVRAPGGPHRAGAAGGDRAADEPDPAGTLLRHRQAPRDRSRLARTGAACSRSPVTRPTCRPAGRAGTGSRSTRPRTSRASARRPASAAFARTRPGCAG